MIMDIKLFLMLLDNIVEYIDMQSEKQLGSVKTRISVDLATDILNALKPVMEKVNRGEYDLHKKEVK